MNFCTNCDNLYYLKLADDSADASLIYYCRNCGNENDTLSADNICVSSTAIKRDKQKYSTI